MKKFISSQLALFAACQLFAQPLVHKDNTVTFRYHNEAAKQVAVDVQFAGRHEMSRDENGVWTVTLGPAASDIYPYCYIVDGIQVMDPEASEFFPNETFKNSLLEVNGQGETLIHTLKDVPHGAVDYVKYWSESMKTYANAIVYTPPFYDRNPQKSYPVMYLISGTTDTEEVYYKVGKVNAILDNLIADGLAQEMIVVLPYGNPSKYFPAGRNTFMMGDLFGKDFVNDLMPYVEKNYRTINDRDHRAIGGFSRGGNQGLMLGLVNLDKFSWLCSYSSFTQTNLKDVYDLEDINDRIHLFWLGVGTDDFLYGNAKDYMDFLDSKGIRNTKVFTEGKFGHTWMNARYFLERTLPLLFQDDDTVSERIAAGTSAAPKILSKNKPDQQKLTSSVMATLFPRQVNSPVYNEDGSVTFRINAPEASEVKLAGPLAEAEDKLVKDDTGVWSITVKPQKADLYQYAFIVDGTLIADQANMFLSPDKVFKYSLADLPRTEPSLIDIQDVPHGKVSYRICHAGNGEETIIVYTPAGYEPQGSERLPVLYLVPGEDDTYENWYKTGRANVILDNLIAKGEASRMIAVMTGSSDRAVKAFVDENYNTLKGADDSFTFGHSGSQSWMDARAELGTLLPCLFKKAVSPVTNINVSGYPKILADNSVVFKFRAPADACPVIDLCNRRYPMSYGPDGMWTVRTAPQVPGFHYYNLIVNGVSTADPASESYYGCSRMSSAIDVPEQGCEMFETQEVPHGQVRELSYYSKLTGSWRPVFVYTPASYEKGHKKYPVVYIHHGGGEDHRGWIQQGRTATIMDNLIAQGKAEEMIVVCVNSNVPAAPGSRGGYSVEGMQPYRTELLDNIVPFIEKNFRVKADRHNRAMCGLSMGGGQSWYVGLRAPEVFANIGVFSAGIFGGIQGVNFDLERECPGILTDTGNFNKSHDTFFVSCGEQDPRITYTRKAVGNMKDAGVDVTFRSYPGDHEWQVWRKSFTEYAQMLFK